MLTITTPQVSLFNDDTQEFIELEPVTLSLEHSLVSLSKWEQKWEKPFLGKEQRTTSETTDYVRCMQISQEVDPIYFEHLSSQNMSDVSDYIAAKMTATMISDNPGGTSNEVVTAELMYYWMIALNIPFECQNWHLNQLLTLIRVCNLKSTPPKKLSRSEIFARNRQLNEERRKQMNTTG